MRHDVTEAEARSKWCPYALIAYEGNTLGGVNRIMLSGAHKDQPAYNAMCIASRCMAWRWQFAGEPKTEKEMAEPHGYCGKVDAHRP